MWGTFNHIQRTILPESLKIEDNYKKDSYNSIVLGLTKLSEQMVLPKHHDDLLDISSRISMLLQFIDDENDVKNKAKTQEVKTLLECLLQMDGQGDSLSLFADVSTWRFIVKGTKFLSNVGESSQQLPLIFPAQLDKAAKIVVDCKNTAKETEDETHYNFLLKFFYSFEFLDSNLSSPFAFDPRSSPLKQALSIMDQIPSKSIRSFLLSEMDQLIHIHCPEFDRKISSFVPPDATREQLVWSLFSSIRSSLESTKEKEENARNAEFAFLRAKTQLEDADLYCTVTSAFLASPHNPTPSYSYHLLCRDPLFVLKFPLAVWTLRSLRKIALTCLQALVRANNFIVVEESPVEDSAIELLTARDAIIVRCLLAILRDANPICSMTTNTIRFLVSSRPGLLGLLVKQGLEERDVDWIVENVPEAFDSQVLLQILRVDQNLAAADAVCRIAIVHGGDVDDSAAAQLTQNALSQLVESFYLILGPVGVSVSALLSDDSETDITQKSRIAAFRILKSLIRVRGRRKVFLPCGATLQKLAGLVKSESTASGLSGTVANTRKQLLKEIFDATSKAVGVLGQNNS